MLAGERARPVGVRREAQPSGSRPFGGICFIALALLVALMGVLHLVQALVPLAR